MLNQALYSSKNMCWCTPQDLYDQLNDEFHFVLDAAATSKSAQCDMYYTVSLGQMDFVPMNQAVEYSGIEMAVNRQGMLRARVLDDDGSFTTQDIIEIRNCPLCGKRFMKGRCV